MIVFSIYDLVDQRRFDSSIGLIASFVDLDTQSVHALCPESNIKELSQPMIKHIENTF
jgi:hypothetical protein